MMKVGEIVGDIVYIKIANQDYLKEIGIKESDGHFLVKGRDELGLWVQHPGLEIIKILDNNGKPLPINKHQRKKIEATFLITWQNIITIMHYPNRENYDFPYKEGEPIGFKLINNN